MQARFNIERDRANKLFIKSYKNDFCLFQFHSQIEIYMVDEGEMEMFVDGKLATLRAGDISVALGYTTHAYKTPEASRSAVILIPPDMCEEFILATRGKRARSPFISNPEIYAEIKEQLAALSEPGINRIKQIGCLFLILGAIMDGIELEDTDKHSDTDLASSILFYINENYKSGITPASVASHFGYSQSYISRYFKACFGITLCKYLTAAKLRSAIMLMHEGKHDVTYCALESGFSSMRTFYRAFHNEFGSSPRDLIEQSQS